MSARIRFYVAFYKLKDKLSKKWEAYPRALKWFFAALRQLPVSLTVAKLPIPYNFSLPCLLACRKTVSYVRHGGERRELGKFYFKTLSRTLFGYSMRRLLEQTAKYTLGAELGISDELIHVISWILICICIFLDATE